MLVRLATISKYVHPGTDIHAFAEGPERSVREKEKAFDKHLQDAYRRVVTWVSTQSSHSRIHTDPARTPKVQSSPGLTLIRDLSRWASRTTKASCDLSSLVSPCRRRAAMMDTSGLTLGIMKNGLRILV
jgi:hypothetical protein